MPAKAKKSLSKAASREAPKGITKRSKTAAKKSTSLDEPKVAAATDRAKSLKRLRTEIKEAFDSFLVVDVDDHECSDDSLHGNDIDGNDIADLVIGEEGASVIIDHQVVEHALLDDGEWIEDWYGNKHEPDRKNDIIFVGTPGKEITASDVLAAFKKGSKAIFQDGRTYFFEGISQVDKISRAEKALFKAAYEAKFGRTLSDSGIAQVFRVDWGS